MAWRSWEALGTACGDGPPLVLLHGASGSWTHWIRNVLPLARERRVLAADMPGYGDSDAPPEPHTAHRLAELVAAGIDGVLPPSTEFDLAGFSFGGIIGGLVAARLGPRIRNLVLLGAGGLGVPPAPIPPLLRLAPGMSEADERRVHRENLKIVMIGDPDAVDDLAVSLQIDNVRRARFKSGTIPVSDVLRQALPKISARIAGIWGSRDAFGGIDERRAVLASVQPGLEFRVIAGAGHWTPYEAADDVNAALRAYSGGGRASPTT